MIRIPQMRDRLDTLMNCKWTITLHLQLGGCLEFQSVCIASLDSAAPLVSLCINPQLNFFPVECSSLSIHCQHQRYFCLLNYLSEAIWGPLLASLPLPSVYSLTRLNLDMKSGVPFLSPSSPVVLIRYTRSSIVEKQPRSGLRVPVDHPSPSYL